MNGPARISIITVVRNGADCLEETIVSVLEAISAARIDYIVIDGGSTDGTLDIIRKYADRITYWVSEPDAGIYHAMNKGWAAARADSFILFLGAGDRIVSLPGDMERFSFDDVVYGQVLMGDDRVFQARVDFHLKLYNSLHHQALLVHKSLHPEPPFNCNYRLYADFDFNQQLMKSGARFVYARDLVGFARPGGASDLPDFAESLRVIFSNYGFLWAALAVSGYYALKCFPFLRGLRPIKEPFPPQKL